MSTNNYIQFTRLLAEINAVGLSKEQFKDLEVSMDLPKAKIQHLLNLAEHEFEQMKEAIK